MALDTAVRHVPANGYNRVDLANEVVQLKLYLKQQVLIDKTMNEFDKDGSGTITRDELPALMRKMAIATAAAEAKTTNEPSAAKEEAAAAPAAPAASEGAEEGSEAVAAVAAVAVVEVTDEDIEYVLKQCDGRGTHSTGEGTVDGAIDRAELLVAIAAWKQRQRDKQQAATAGGGALTTRSRFCVVS